MIASMLTLCIGVALAFVALPVVGWPIVLAFFAAAFAGMAWLYWRTMSH